MRTFVISPKKSKLIGVFHSKSHATAEHPTGVHVHGTTSLKRQLTKRELAQVYNQVSKRKVRTFANKDVAAARVMTLLYTLPVQGRQAVHAKVREFFLSGGVGSSKQIAESIEADLHPTQMAISDLQNDKYAGPEGRLFLIKNEYRQWELKHN